MSIKTIIRDHMDTFGFTTYAGVQRDDERGALAAQLYATWKSYEVAEALVETDYSRDDQVVRDLIEVMKHHGAADFDDRCREFGKKMVIAAIDYVLDAHDREGKDVAEDVRRNAVEAWQLSMFEKG